ncbi:MAG TPA: nuclear transport factor 2 family protein [bacterium]|nr:nuclear transport factor 2 family protein [bacterium]
MLRDRADPAVLREAALALLTRYVRVVDDPRRLEEWPELFTADGAYVVVTRENVERGLPVAIVRDDTQERIQDRLTVIREFWGAGGRAEDRHYNEAWPRHLIGPAWAEPAEDGRWRLGAHLAVYLTQPLDGSSRLLCVGCYDDVVEFSAQGPRFRAKTVILDTPVLPDIFVYPL